MSPSVDNTKCVVEGDSYCVGLPGPILEELPAFIIVPRLPSARVLFAYVLYRNIGEVCIAKVFSSISVSSPMISLNKFIYLAIGADAGLIQPLQPY